MQPFTPSKIYVDQEVSNLAWTRRVLQHFPKIIPEIIADPESVKKPLPLSDAKKRLFITKFKGEAIRPCQGIGEYVCCNYLTISPVSNCHMECTYCILQDYLKNNPLITLYANIDEILDNVESKVQSEPATFYRMGTGELSDSLALDSITNYSHYLVPFAARHNNLVLELKTKSNQVDNLLHLEHGNRTVISWSLNPQEYIDLEELKTSSLKERFEAARRVANAGYPVGFHLDPLLALEGWKEKYEDLVRQIKDLFEPEEIAWISLGSLRFTKDLKTIAIRRFPKSVIFFGELYPSQDGKIRYFREIREELYEYVKTLIDATFPDVPNYLCMETPGVWQKIYRTIPNKGKNLDHQLSSRFII